ncbi:MAG TPA: hypothetical protein VK172_07055 [Lentimicrobium sp.]|nr:hypothetical protein [Lentimicrobium sp.]
MKQFFDLLFYKYYRFQIRVKNEDIAEYISTLLVAFFTSFYIIATFLLLKIYFGLFEFLFHKRNGVSIIFVLFLIFGVYYFRKKRYKSIIDNMDIDYRNKYNWLPWLYPIIGWGFLTMAFFLI